jgi:hypothetical protein
LGLSILALIGLGLVWFKFERIAAEGKKQLAAAIAETDALDPRWRWEEIQEGLPTIPDDENSMLIIGQLAGSRGKWQPSEFSLPEGEDVTEAWPANRHLDEERLKLIRVKLEQREQDLALAVSLKDFPRGHATVQIAPDLLSTSLEHAQNCRLPLFLLRFDLERLLQNGQLQEATIRIHATLHAVAGLRQDFFLISQLVRMAGRRVAAEETERLLGMGEIGDAELARLAAHFGEEVGENLMLIGVCGERAGWHFVFDNLESGRLPLADFFAQAEAFGSKSKPSASNHISSFIYQPRLYEDHAFMLKWMNDAWAIAQLPISEQVMAWKEHEDEIRTVGADARAGKGRILCAFFLPSLRRVAEASMRDQASLSCVQVALASERFRLAHKRWPQDLQELCPVYLKMVPIDPFDGTPLKMSQRDDGIVIYSVDRDGEDDGGDVHKKSPDDEAPKDLGVRLWNPDHRGLPPEPKKEQANDDEEL